MALPTSDNTVNVTRLGSILNTLWGKIKTKLGTKVDKVANATSGNLASLDSNGNLTDSTKSVSDLQSTYQAPRTLKVGGQVEIVSAEYPSNRKDITFTKTDGTSAGTLGSLVPVPDSSKPGQILKVGSQAGSIEWNNIPNIAPEFSTSSTYDVNDRVMYQGQLYRCTSAVTTAGGWNSSNWTAVNLSDEIDSLSSELNDKQGLQGNQGTQIPANSDLNTYTTPGNYYIASAADMATISNTPFAQMGFSSSETAKTGHSQVTVYNMDGTSSGRVMQVMYTIYSTNPSGDNAFGFWYRMSSGGSSQTWGDWHRMLQTNGYAPYRYGSATPSTATKSAELLKVKVGSTTTYQSITLGVTISAAASNLHLFALVTFSIRGNTPKIDAQVITSNFPDNGIVRFCAYNDEELKTTFSVIFPEQDDLTWLNVTYQVLDHSGVLYESKTFPSFNNVWLLYNPQLTNSIPVYTAFTDVHWNRYLDARVLSNRTNWKITATSEYIGLKPGVYGAGTGDFVYFKLFSGTLSNWTSIIANLLWIQGANTYNNEDALNLSIRINFQTDLTAPSLAVINYENPTGMAYTGDRVPYLAFYHKVANGTITVYLKMKTAGNYQQNLLLKSYSSNMSSVVFYKAESIDEGTVPSGLTQITFIRRPLYKTGTGAVGSTTQPVYVTAEGQVNACSVKEVAHYYNTSGTEMDYTKRCHFINDCNNGTTVKYILVRPEKLIENVAYDIGGVLLNSSAAYYIGVRYTASGSDYKVYGNRHSISLSSATTETYKASIKLVRIGTNIYVIGY